MHYMFHSLGGFLGGVLGYFVAAPTNEPCGAEPFFHTACQNAFGSTGTWIGNYAGIMAGFAIVGVIVGHVVEALTGSEKSSAT